MLIQLLKKYKVSITVDPYSRSTAESIPAGAGILPKTSDQQEVDEVPATDQEIQEDYLSSSFDHEMVDSVAGDDIVGDILAADAAEEGLFVIFLLQLRMQRRNLLK